jgi:cytochrome P450
MSVAASAPLRLPPAHRGHWLLGSLPELRRSPHQFLQDMCERYGDVVTMRFGPLSAWLVRDPQAVEHILVANRQNWVKTGSPAYETLRLVLGDGLVTSEGDTWLKHRRLMQPAFHRERLDGFARTMVEEAERTAARLDEAARAERTIDVAREMLLYTQRVVLRTLLSVDVDDEKASSALADALGVGLVFVEHRSNSLLRFPMALPLPSHRRFHAARAVLDAEVQHVINTKRARRQQAREAQAAPTHRADLLDMLMDAVDEETGAVLDDKELSDEVMTLFLAGHETTSNLLSWTLALLAENPDGERALVEELAPGGGADGVDVAAAMQAPLLGRTLLESLRLRPPVWVVDRLAVKQDVLAGYDVPAGTLVLVSPWVLHRSPREWPDPERFDPDRFLPENEAKRHKLSFIPFLAGQRKCIGDQFALMEARIALATWLPRFIVRPLVTPEAESVVTLRPKGGMPCRVTRRATSGAAAR